MIIGVTGSTESKNRETSKFLSDKYDFVIVDGEFKDYGRYSWMYEKVDVQYQYKKLKKM